VTSIMTAELIGEAPATPPKTKRRRKASTAAKAAKAAKNKKKRLHRSVQASNSQRGKFTRW